MEGNCLCFISKKDAKVVVKRHKGHQMLPQKKGEVSFFFLTVLVIRGVFLCKALINKASIVEPVWTFDIYVLRIGIYLRLLVPNNYDIFMCSLHESDLCQISDRLNSSATTNALGSPYPINHTKA